MKRLAALASALAIVVLFLAVIFYGWRPISNYDIFWHMATGRLILEQKELPAKNTFNYPNPDEPYKDECWLFDLASHVFWLFFGAYGICGYAAVAIFLTFLFLFLALIKRGVPAPIAVLIVLLSLLLIKFRFLARNFLLSHLFFAVYLYFLPTSEERTQKRALILYPLIMVLWANVHVGCYIGVGIAALGLISSLLKKSDDFPKPKFWFALFIVVFIASGVSPYPFLWVERLFYNLVVYIPIPSLENRPSLPHEFGFFYLSLFFTVLLVVFGFRRLHPFWTLGIFSLGAVSIFFLRFQGDYGIFLAIFLGEAYLAWSKSRYRYAVSIQQSLAVLLSVIAIVIVVAKGWSDYDPRAVGCRVDCELLPCGATSFMNDRLSPAPIYNNMGFGGYIEWRLFPKWETFWDSRYYPQVKKAALVGKEGLGAVLDYYKAGYALVSMRHDLLRFEKIFLSGKWIPVYFDRASVLLVNKDLYPDVAKDLGFFAIRPLERALPPNPELLDLAQSELSRAKALVGVPDVFLNEFELRILIRKKEFDKAEAVLNRSLKSWPKVGSLLALGGELYLKMDRLDDALKMLEAAKRNGADTASVLSNLGVAYWRLGKFNRAICSFKGAIARYQNFTPAIYNLHLLYESLGDSEKSKIWRDRYKKITERVGPAEGP